MKQKRNTVLVWEELNVLTLFIAKVLQFFFPDQLFISTNLSGQQKTAFLRQLPSLKWKQLHFFQDKTPGFYSRLIEDLLQITAQHDKQKRHSEWLVNYTGEARFKSTANYMFTNSNQSRTRSYTLLKLASEKHPDNSYLFVAKSFGIVNDFIDRLPNVRLIAPFAVLDWVAQTWTKLGLLFKMTTHALAQVRNARRNKNVPTPEKQKFSFMLVHRLPWLERDETTNRDMYYFTMNMVENKACLHTCEHGTFTDEKKALLEENGSKIFYLSELNWSPESVLKRLGKDFFAHFLPFGIKSCFSSSVSITHLRSCKRLMRYILNTDSLLENYSFKYAIFSHDLSQFTTVLTLHPSADRPKTLFSPHGLAPFAGKEYFWRHIAVDHVIGTGELHHHLRDNTAWLGDIHGLGRLEIDSGYHNSIPVHPSIQKAREQGKTIVFITNDFAFYMPKCVDLPFYGELLDHTALEQNFRESWQPFFDWASRQEEYFFVFKGKEGRNQYAESFLKRALEKINRENFLQDDTLDLVGTIAAADMVLTNEGSTIFYYSMCLGTPAIMFFQVYGPDHFRIYHEHQCSLSAQDLIGNIEKIREHGLAESVFAKVRKDHYAQGDVDFQTSQRLRSLLSSLANN